MLRHQNELQRLYSKICKQVIYYLYQDFSPKKLLHLSDILSTYTYTTASEKTVTTTIQKLYQINSELLKN
ncbi:MAG: hypothetical protein RL728_952 [Bacteroidota bacterium]|jgi:hypothetical protein